MEKVVLAGFGGQGVLFAGKLLAYAGMLSDKEVSWICSYGPEMRGGTANCAVSISDQKIASPMPEEFDSALIYNGPSLEKFLSKVKKNGLVVVNSSLVERRKIPKGVQCLWIDAQNAAERIGSAKAVNLVLLGAYLQARNLIPWDSINEALKKILSSKNESVAQMNLRAIEEGRRLALG